MFCLTGLVVNFCFSLVIGNIHEESNRICCKQCVYYVS